MTHELERNRRPAAQTGGCSDERPVEATPMTWQGPERRRRAEIKSDTYVQGLVVEGVDGLEEVHVLVGTRDPGRLEATLRHGFEGVLARHAERPEFSGRVRLLVLSELTPQTPDVWELVRRVEEELSSEAGATRTAYGKLVSVSVESLNREDLGTR